MKKSIFIFSAIIAAAILFYPQATISLSTGSPGGKTGSPADNADCMQCHSVLGTTSTLTTITSNIPFSGYVPGVTYTITANIDTTSSLSGFEVTCEENTTNTKTGALFITNSTETQLVNNGNSVTHKAAGNSMTTWSFDWEAPVAGTGDITFYGAFIEASYPLGNNQGDLFSSTTLSFSEATVNSTINLSEENDFTFNSITKTIELPDNAELLVYNMEGKLVLSSNKKHISLSHLPNGIYLIKSANNSQRVLIN